MAGTRASHGQKRIEILTEAQKFLDEKGNIDLTRMRLESPNTYNSVSYYFGSIDGLLVAYEDFKNGTFNADEIKGIPKPESGTSLTRAVIRNQLAYDHLKYLRNEKHLSLEDIGKMYGVSRMYLSKLFRELEGVFESAEQAVETTEQ